MTLTAQIKDYVNAAFSGLWVQTHEPDEAQREIAELAEIEHWQVGAWDCARGLHNQGQNDPLYPLKPVARGTSVETALVLLHNYHRFLQNPVVVQTLFNALGQGKQDRTFFVVLSPVVQIPAELERVFQVLEHPLPTAESLEEIALDVQSAADAEEARSEALAAGATEAEANRRAEQAAEAARQKGVERGILEAATGLTRAEAEGAFALATARRGVIHPGAVWELKAQMLKKSGLLELHRGRETFSDLGGLDNLKSFCRKALPPGASRSPKRPSARGVLLLGVSGTGKSAFAKALGNETGRPTLLLDVGSLYGSLVGQTEERIRLALRIADAMAPCVLFCDEIEKALSGVGSQGDGGVATRLFGTLLTWLNDHTSDVFFVGTCNDVSKLPPEFTRAERFDGVFFIDLPSEAEKASIWGLYLSQYQVGFDGHDRPQADNWTGAEIRACCRLAALLDVPLAEAARHVVPVAVTAADKVQALREWASGRCLSASTPGLYHHQPHNTNGARRRVQKGNS